MFRPTLTVLCCVMILTVAMSGIALRAEEPTEPLKIFSGEPRLLVVNGYSTSFQWWAFLQRKIDRYLAYQGGPDDRVVEVQPVTKGGTPISGWMSIDTGERSMAWEQMLTPTIQREKGKRPVIILAQQSLQGVYPEGRSAGISGVDDRERIERGADVLGQYAKNLLEDGAAEVVIGMHIYKKPMEPQIGNERLALVELFKRKPAHIFSGPDVWTPTSKQYPLAFDRDRLHPNYIGAEIMAHYWFAALLEREGLDVPDWSRQEMEEAVEKKPLGQTRDRQLFEQKLKEWRIVNRRPSSPQGGRRSPSVPGRDSGGRQIPRFILERYDKNGDGTLSEDERAVFLRERARRNQPSSREQVPQQLSKGDFVAVRASSTSRKNIPEAAIDGNLLSKDKNVTTRTFTGPISGDEITLDVYTPDNYDENGQGYPVIYNLHGRGGTYNNWDPQNFRKAMVDAISKGLLPPVIAVYPDGTKNGWYADSKDKTILIETHIIREIIPWVDSEYNTKPSKQFRVIQGMSMGGYGASLYAVKFPELFSICINYDGAMWNWDNMTRSSGKWDAVAPVMFGNDEDYYNEHSSPWSIAARSKDRIAGKVVFRTIEGSLGEWLSRWRDHLEGLGIDMDYVKTSCRHNLPCLHEQAGEGSFRLMAEQFKKAASTMKTRPAQRGQRAKQRRRQTQAKERPETTPTYENVKYGPHERNVLDFYQAKSDSPAPVAVYIHGGGFRKGGKHMLHRWYSDVLEKCLDAGVSVVAINYRFTDSASLPEIFRDAARAVQFIRHNAEKWNVDETRFGAFGASAGAGTSLWLASHDDLADPTSSDPVLRESSRIQVVGGNNCQATYDRQQAREIAGSPPGNIEEQSRKSGGLEGPTNPNSPEAKLFRKEVNMLGMMTADDAPVFLYNKYDNGDATDGSQYVHHPRHSFAIKKKCEELGLDTEMILKYESPSIAVEEINNRMLAFFFKHLKVSSHQRQERQTLRK